MAGRLRFAAEQPRLDSHSPRSHPREPRQHGSALCTPPYRDLSGTDPVVWTCCGHHGCSCGIAKPSTEAEMDVIHDIQSFRVLLLSVLTSCFFCWLSMRFCLCRLQELAYTRMFGRRSLPNTSRPELETPALKSELLPSVPQARQHQDDDSQAFLPRSLNHFETGSICKSLWVH